MTTRRIQRTYYVILALYWLATGLPMALGMLLAQARGLDLFQLGLIVGAYSLTIVVLEVPTGGLADAIGRKRVALLAYGCALVSSVMFLFAFSFPALLLAFVLSGIGRALSSGALDAWFVDSLQAADPEVELQPALAKAGTVTLLALGSGALLGSALPRIFDTLPADGSAVLTPLSTPLLLGAMVQVAMLVLTLFLVKEQRPADSSQGLKQGILQVPAIIRIGVDLTRHNPTILRLLAVSFASGLILISLEVLWQPHFAGLLGGAKGNSLLFGLIMGGNFLAGMIGNLLSAPLSRLLHKRYGLVAAIFQGVRGAALMGLALQTTALPASLLFWLVYMTMGVVNSPHATLLNHEIPARQRSSMLSIESFVAYLGSILGSAGLSYVAKLTSIHVAWFIGGVILVASLGLYLSIDSRQKESHVQTDAGFKADQKTNLG